MNFTKFVNRAKKAIHFDWHSYRCGTSYGLQEDIAAIYADTDLFGRVTIYIHFDITPDNIQYVSTAFENNHLLIGHTNYKHKPSYEIPVIPARSDDPFQKALDSMVELIQEKIGVLQDLINQGDKK